MLHVSYPNLFNLMNANTGEKPRQLTFAELCALEHARIPFPSSDLDGYNAEEQEIKDILHRRIERRRQMFLAHLNVLWVTSKNSIFKNLIATLRAGSSFKVANTSSIRHFSFLPSLGLIQIFLTKAIFRGDLWKYRETIRQDDRCRKVPIDFLYRIFSKNPVSLSFGALLELWKSPMFQSKCDCGETAFIVDFCGFPLSGCYRAKVQCPHCGKDFLVGNYDDTHKLLQRASFFRLVKEVRAAKKKNEAPDENTVKFETLVGELRRMAFFESGKTE